MVKWFRCFADVPGIGYKGIYRPQLPEQVLVPQPKAYGISTLHREYLNWPMIGGGTGITSASPVKQWTTQPRSGESATQRDCVSFMKRLNFPEKC